MKEHRAIRGLVIALIVFVLWGNVISLLLPAEDYGAVTKTVDFATVLFLLAILIAVIIGTVRERSKNSPKDREK